MEGISRREQLHTQDQTTVPKNVNFPIKVHLDSQNRILPLSFNPGLATI